MKLKVLFRNYHDYLNYFDNIFLVDDDPKYTSVILHRQVLNQCLLRKCHINS